MIALLLQALCTFMIITACELNQRLNDRLQDGKHHMTRPDSLLNMEKTKRDTLFSRLMCDVVKRSSISAHNAFIREESGAAATDREGNSLV